MSITIADCLKLPSLCSCRVIAGERGLDHIVNSATVLEVFDSSTFDVAQPVNQQRFDADFLCVHQGRLCHAVPPYRKYVSVR